MRWHYKSWPALIVLSPAIITLPPCILALLPGILNFTTLSVNMFPNQVASNVPNNVPRNPLFVLLLHFELFQ